MKLSHIFSVVIFFAVIHKTKKLKRSNWRKKFYIKKYVADKKFGLSTAQNRPLGVVSTRENIELV
jgi:hypothetical protein